MRTVFMYRGTLTAFLLSALALIALQYLMWRGVFKGATSMTETQTAFGGSTSKAISVTFRQVVLYSVLARLWAFIVPGFWMTKEFERRVREGSILRDLLNPQSLVGAWLARSCGRSAGWLLIVAAPVVVVGFVWAQATLSLGTVCFAVIALISGYLIAFSLAAFVGLSALFLRRAAGLSELRDALISVLGGSLVPLVFYPHSLVSIIEWLPFVDIYYIPMGLLSGMGVIPWHAVVASACWAAGLLTLLVIAVHLARTRLVLDAG